MSQVASTTVRAILYAGGFFHHDRRWFAATENEHGGRKLRAALVQTLVDREESKPERPIANLSEKQLVQVQAIRARLTELVTKLREQGGKR